MAGRGGQDPRDNRVLQTDRRVLEMGTAASHLGKTTTSRENAFDFGRKSAAAEVALEPEGAE